jgi:hypothetical protein
MKKIDISCTYLLILLIGFCAAFNPIWGDTINEDIQLFATDSASGDEFGHSISMDNGVAAIGAPFDDDNGTNSGAAYLFDVSTGEQIVKLLPLDGVAGAEFGFSIAINNGIVAVGARADDENGDGSGAAYLFNVSDGTQLVKLIPTDAEPGDEFGNSIAIDNGIVAVGAWQADEYGDGSGAAYLFDASTGNQLDKLLPPTGNNYQTFGVSIAMDDGLVVIGARTFFDLNEGFIFAKAHLFDVSTGDQLNEFQPDILDLNGDQGGRFADAIDIDNGLVAVGAPNRSVVFDHSGAAYVFDVSTGSQLTYIVPDDAYDRDNFGISISIDNGNVAVGAHQDDDNGSNSGSAYLYDALTGNEIHKLLASNGAEFDLLGASVAINEDVTVVGAKGYTESHTGSVYVYSGTTNGIEDMDSNLSENFALNQNYPNPFNPVTSLSYDLPEDSFVSITIYDMLGNVVNNLINTNQSSGYKSVKWNATNNQGQPVSSGVYLYSIEAGDFRKTKKMILLK